MFAQVNPGRSHAQRGILLSSLALHGLVLAWMLHRPEPQLLNPVSIKLGSNGKVLTQLYWKSQTPDDSKTSSSDTATEVYRRQRLLHQKLEYQRSAKLAKLPPLPTPVTPDTEDKSKTSMLSKLGHGAQGGLAYGTLNNGPAYGDEIRPALPAATKDPFTYPWELPDSEGNVVVEITIDERGEIVAKSVLQSMGPKLDEKVLAALESWHFRPATHNGVAIPSKQDAIFHFRARG